MRTHDKKIRKDQVKCSDTFITIDSPGWRNPQNLDIDSLRDILNISGESSNVFVHEFKDQATDFSLPPGAHKLDKTLELSVDDNFLYVWVKNRWKRIPLTEF